VIIATLLLVLNAFWLLIPVHAVDRRSEGAQLPTPHPNAKQIFDMRPCKGQWDLMIPTDCF